MTRGGLVGFEALGRWLCGYGAAWVRNAGMKMIKGRWKLHFNGVKQYVRLLLVLILSGNLKSLKRWVYQAFLW